MDQYLSVSHPGKNNAADQFLSVPPSFKTQQRRRSDSQRDTAFDQQLKQDRQRQKDKQQQQQQKKPHQKPVSLLKDAKPQPTPSSGSTVDAPPSNPSITLDLKKVRSREGSTSSNIKKSGGNNPKPKHPKRNSISDAFSAFSTSPGSWRDEESPFGPLDQIASRRVFAYLVSVLNSSDPDHDFSSLLPEHFQRETNPNTVINSFNNALFGLGMPLPPRLWDCVNRIIDTNDCMTFSFSPPESFLADEPRLIWSMMWFFFNKRKKRVLYIHLKALRHHQSPNMGPRDPTAPFDFNNTPNESEYDLTQYSDDEVVGGLEMD